MKWVNYIKQKRVRLLFVAAMAILVAGAGPGAVRAAIPDGEAQIRGCYRDTSSSVDSKGDLRVIDTEANEECATDETAISWGPERTAYGYVDSGGALDTDRSKNITSVTPVGPVNGNYGICIYSPIIPKTMLITQTFVWGTSPLVSVRGIENGSGIIDDFCGETPEAQAFVLYSQGGFFFSFF